jgi:hypothetical protein
MGATSAQLGNDIIDEVSSGSLADIKHQTILLTIE